MASYTFNLANKRYFAELQQNLEEDDMRGEEEDQRGNIEKGEIQPEKLFYQDEYDAEISSLSDATFHERTRLELKSIRLIRINISLCILDKA